MNEYFKVMDDLESKSVFGRWHLGDPVDSDGSTIDARAFCQGRHVDTKGPISVGMAVPGKPLDFTFTTLAMPVARREIGAILETFAPDGIQRIPVTIAGHPGDYEILNFTRTIRCVDERRTMIERWKAVDNRPDRPPGTYRRVYNLHILPERVIGCDCFRVQEWMMTLVFSESVVRALQRTCATGILFQSVT